MKLKNNYQQFISRCLITPIAVYAASESLDGGVVLGMVE